MGNMVAQLLALLPHSKRVLGSAPGPFCVEFAYSPFVWISARGSGFLQKCAVWVDW